jgi:hypothetical protein
MKNELITLIRVLGITSDEVFINIIIGDVKFESIEWRRKGNQVILHKFIDTNDLEFNYDELSKILKREVYLFLLREVLN